MRSINKKENLSRNPWAVINAEFPKDKNGVIYVRQSSIVQMQTNVHSYEMQTGKFLEHFRNMGCTGLIEIIPDDEAMSGTLDIHKMPGLSRIVRLIEGKELLYGEPIGWVAAVAVNRLTRDQWLIKPGILMKSCYENDVWIATLRMHFNFKDTYCQRVFMLEAEEAARHLEWMKLVLGGAKSTASDNGYYDGRLIVPGYIVDRTDIRRKRYIVYEPHAEVIRWLFRRFFELDGNFPRLCREINDLPFIFPKFESWVDGKTVSRFSLNKTKLKLENVTPEGHYRLFKHGLQSILTNPVYIGWWLPLDGGVIKDSHEAIIEEALFTYAHKRLSSHTLEGERQKPERVTRYAEVEALLQNVVEDADGTSVYALRAKGGVYSCREQRGSAVMHDRFVIYIHTIDPVFLVKFFERLQHWEGCEDWEDRYFQQKAEKESTREQQQKLIKRQVKEAIDKMQEIMDTVETPGCPKSMKEKLFKDYEGLEIKKKELDALLIPDSEAEEDDEELLFQIQTLLPGIIDRWDELPFAKRLRFIGALVDKVILSHVSPSWMRMEIRWKRTDWESDIAHIRRKSSGERWTDEEKELVKALYPNASALDILHALPMRSWMGLKLQAYALGARREIVTYKNLAFYGIDEQLCWQDREYMQQNNIVLSTNRQYWSN